MPNSPDYKHKIDKRFSRECSLCGKTYFKKFLVSMSQWKESKFCSDACRVESRKGAEGFWTGKKRPDISGENNYLFGKKRENLSGEKHWNWHGGIHRSSTDMERITFYRTVRKQVLERDDYTCAMCSVRGINMHVDHIVPWSEDKDLRFSLDNCRTLCVNCHYKITFGKEMPSSVKTFGLNFGTYIKKLGVN